MSDISSHFLCLMSDVWYLRSDVWCPMSDVRCLMSDIWCPRSDVWCLMSDVRYLMPDVCYLMCDVFCPFLCFTSHIWYPVSDNWCPLCDGRCLMPITERRLQIRVASSCKLAGKKVNRACVTTYEDVNHDVNHMLHLRSHRSEVLNRNCGLFIDEQ